MILLLKKASWEKLMKCLRQQSVAEVLFFPTADSIYNSLSVYFAMKEKHISRSLT